jgi:glucose/mannose-6-phosphate isomerase
MRGIDEVDTSNMRSMVAAFPQLLVAKKLDESTAKAASEIGRRGIKGVCLTGMGGSSIAGEFARALLTDDASAPVLVTRDYTIPKAVNRDWVVVATSYSGNTEETLISYDAAVRRQATVFVITTGGEIVRRAKDGIVHLIPEGLQPRAAFPLIFCGLYSIVRAVLGLPRVNLDVMSKNLSRTAQSWGKRVEPPHKLADLLKDSIPVFTGWKHLAPVAYRAKCQVNENAKTVAFWSDMPEANHNEVEATVSYQRLSIEPVFLRSKYEDERIARRFDITSDVYSGSGCKPVEISIDSASMTEEALGFAHYLDTVSVELAELRGVDPLSVERISELKGRLEPAHQP